jgi:hypothetical protein
VAHKVEIKIKHVKGGYGKNEYLVKICLLQKFIWVHYPQAQGTVAPGSPQPIVDMHNGPITCVGNGSSYSNDHGSFSYIFYTLN